MILTSRPRWKTNRRYGFGRGSNRPPAPRDGSATSKPTRDVSSHPCHSTLRFQRGEDPDIWVWILPLLSLLAATTRTSDTRPSAAANSTRTHPGTAAAAAAAAHARPGAAHGPSGTSANRTRRHSSAARGACAASPRAHAPSHASSRSAHAAACAGTAGLCERRDRCQDQANSQCRVNDRAHFLPLHCHALTPGISKRKAVRRSCQMQLALWGCPTAGRPSPAGRVRTATCGCVAAFHGPFLLKPA